MNSTLSRKIWLLAAMSPTVASAWNEDVYHSVREGILGQTTYFRSTSKDASGISRVYAWDKGENEYAEKIARVVGDDKDAEARKNNFWKAYNAITDVYTPNENKGYNPFVNAYLAVDFAVKFSVSDKAVSALQIKMGEMKKDLEFVYSEAATPMKERKLRAALESVLASSI